MSEIGTLIVVVLKAQNLIDKHFFKQDVYCQISLNDEVHRTPVDVKGGQHPVWDEEIRFPILKGAGAKNRKLKIGCYSKEHKSKGDEDLGQASVDITETLSTGEFDDWVPLSLENSQRGEVYLEMTFYSNAPIPAPPPSQPKPQKRPPVANTASDLKRRPSKWKPDERLARPDQQQDYTQMAASRGRGNARLSPGRAGKEADLPPVPGALSAGRGRGGPLGGAASPPQHVPSILRPRNPKSSGAPRPASDEFTSSAPDIAHLQPGYNSSGTNTPNPYVQGLGDHHRSQSDTGYPYPGATPNPYEQPNPYAASQYPPHSQTPIPLGPYGGDDTGNSPLNFPTPNVPGGVGPPTQSQAPYRPSQSPPVPGAYPPRHSPSPYPPSSSPSLYPPQQNQAPYTQPSHQYSHPPREESLDNLPDPYLKARYGSPLPLPPGSTPPPRSRALSGADQDESSARKAREKEEERRKKEEEERLRQEEEEARRREKERRENEEARQREDAKRREEEEKQRRRLEEERRQAEAEERERVERVRKAEQDARKRKEQADLDREIARKLDEERREEQRRVEEEAARRRAQAEADEELARKLANEAEEQEDKDLELAKQLDRELNMAAANAQRRESNAVHMPGEW